MNFIPIDRVLYKLSTEMPSNGFDEDIITEWIGEALSFIEVPAMKEQAVQLVHVQNHEACLPKHFHNIIQIRKNSSHNSFESLVTDVVECQDKTTIRTVDENGDPIEVIDELYIRPNYDMRFDFINLMQNTCYNEYTPVRLSDHTFFSSLVCKETGYENLYKNCRDEYTIRGGIGGGKLMFSFKEGLVAIAYFRNILDEETGYPLIPDNISVITALSYYVKWKISEIDLNLHKQGASNVTEYNEKRWLKYVTQGRNALKMPQNLDEWKNLKDNYLSFIPKEDGYYRYFGN